MQNKIKVTLTLRPETRQVLAALVAAGKGESMSDMVDQLVVAGGDAMLGGAQG